METSAKSGLNVETVRLSASVNPPEDHVPSKAQLGLVVRWK